MKVYKIGSDEHLALIGKRLIVAGIVVTGYALVKSVRAAVKEVSASGLSANVTVK